MFVVIEGVIRRRSFSGLGPFRREKWDEQPFSCELTKDGEKKVLDGLSVERLDRDGRIYVNASVGGVPCYLADLNRENPKQIVEFNMLSVASLQIRGRARLRQAQSSQRDAFIA